MRGWLFGVGLAFWSCSGVQAQISLEGRYAGRGEGKLSAAIKTAKGGPDRYDIVLRTRARNCAGDVSGRGILQDGVVTLRAKTDDPKGCTIRIEPKAGTLKVEEGEGCLYFHGVSCGFSGTLKRR